MNSSSSPIRVNRKEVPADFEVGSWEDLSPFFIKLQEQSINSLGELTSWLSLRSELESLLEEDMAWRYIRMNLNTEDLVLAERFNYFAEHIEPRLAPIQYQLDLKLIQSPFIQGLGADYQVYLKNVQTRIQIYREKNIPILSALQVKAQKYGAVQAAMTISWEGKEITLQKASLHLKLQDRSLREQVYRLIEQRRSKDAPELQALMDELINYRSELSENAGFDNFRDYMFVSMGRFYYTKQDCFDFHQSIQQSVLPIVTTFHQERKQVLSLDQLKPWDTEVDLKKPLPAPYQSSQELIEKTIHIFGLLDKEFAICLQMMNQSGFLDLESRKGKAPGGFNYPLFESGLPFIYMNSVGLLRDLVTMLHEGGHAVHSYLTKDLAIADLKSFPSEVAELASMTMELITMDHWDIFYPNPDDLRQAKLEHLEKIIQALPWIAAVDQFQHWIYENHGHTVDQRNQAWLDCIKSFSTSEINWDGLEANRSQSWLKQLHIFEVPFYYIEYGFAQLGAIAIWRNYKINPTQTIQEYKKALSLGNTRSIPEIYQQAGIEFRFDSTYVSVLADFVLNEIKALKL